jgi:hypothetical protein
MWLAERPRDLKLTVPIAEPDAQPIPVPVEQAMVACGVYVDGMRLPGAYTHSDAQAKVREIQQTGQGAFVWIGLHEPDERQMHDVANVYGLHPLAAEDAVSAHQRPKLERYDETLLLGPENRQLRSARFGGLSPGDRRDRRDHDLRRQGFRGHRPAR